MIVIFRPPRREQRAAPIMVLAMKAIMDLPQVGQAFNDMAWQVLTIGDGIPETFLTSDRAIYLPMSLGNPRGTVILPLSPRKLFIASRSPAVFEGIASHGPRGVTVHMNAAICRQAHSYVYGRDAESARFVDRRLQKYPDATHWATFFKALQRSLWRVLGQLATLICTKLIEALYSLSRSGKSYSAAVQRILVSPDGFEPSTL